MKYDIDFLKNKVKEFQDEKRFIHTLGVANEAYILGNIFMPEKAEKLMVAGILHDITKCFDAKKHIELCCMFNLPYDKEKEMPKLFHAKTGCEFARELFGNEIVDDEIYSSILYHTTGRENMTVFEAIIYLADYIEAGRTFSDCLTLREFFYKNIGNAKKSDDKLEVLRKTMLFSFNLTIKNLIEEGKKIDFDTIKARNYYLNK